MRRLIMLCLSLMLALPIGGVAAQDASPEPAGAFDTLGLPTLDITVTAEGYDGIPATVEAGRYLVTLRVSEDTGEFGGGIGFVQPPAGMSAADFVQQAYGPPDESGSAGTASPVAGSTEASPDTMGGPPPFIFDARFAGGAFGDPGETVQIVLDLPPGEWIAWGDDPEATQEPVIFEATGEMPGEMPEPEAAATITMGEYIIEVTDGALRAGPQVVRVDNIGAQPHFLLAAKGPDGMTEAQIGTILDEEMEAQMAGAEPAYSDLDPNVDITEEGFFTGTQSGGTSQWVLIDVAPGSYVLICFFPDLGDGMPHAYHGMYTVVEVSS